jgi:hypothetical protein
MATRRIPRPRVPAAARAALVASVLTISAAAPAATQPAAPGQFVADLQSGCKVWNPHPQPGETVLWSGPCANGLAEGAGRLQWLKDGKPYERDEGAWRQGRQEGRGSQDWTSGRYDGELSGGEPQGQGVLTLRTARYAGEFQAGKPNGTGTLTGLDGSFRGVWKDGCLVGDKRNIAFGVSSAGCK